MEHQPRRRRRPALSCIGCRRRKIKCNRDDPCAHCVSAKIQCTYRIYSNDATVSVTSPSAHAASPLAQAQQVSTDGPVRDLGSNPSGPRVAVPAVREGQNETSQNETSYTSGRNDIQPQNSVQEEEPTLTDLWQRVRKLEESSASNPIRGLFENGRDILARQSGLQDSQIILNKTRILNWSHWMGTAQEVQSASIRVA